MFRLGPLLIALLALVAACAPAPVPEQAAAVARQAAPAVAVKPGFPECARLTSQGFIEFLGSRARGDGRAVPVASSRPSPTRLIFDTRVA